MPRKISLAAFSVDGRVRKLTEKWLKVRGIIDLGDDGSFFKLEGDYGTDRLTGRISHPFGTGVMSKAEVAWTIKSAIFLHPLTFCDRFNSYPDPKYRGPGKGHILETMLRRFSDEFPALWIWARRQDAILRASDTSKAFQILKIECLASRWIDGALPKTDEIISKIEPKLIVKYGARPNGWKSAIEEAVNQNFGKKSKEIQK